MERPCSKTVESWWWGGVHQTQSLAETEIFDPGTGEWSAGPPLNEPRSTQHAVVGLDDGRILVVGGSETPSAEIFAPGSGRWEYTEPMHFGSRYGSAVLLTDGRAMAIGGWQRDASDSGDGPLFAEILDPDTNEWTLTGPLPRRQGLGGKVVMADGRVLVTGGWLNGPGNLALTLIFEPDSGEWTQGVPGTGTGHQSVVLPDGRVAVVGHHPTRLSIPIYDPVSDSWDNSVKLNITRISAGVVVLPTGQILITGGSGGFEEDLEFNPNSPRDDASILSSVEVLTPQTVECK